MGDLIFTDFKAKDGTYTKGGGVDDMKFLPIEDTAPSEILSSEMPVVKPNFVAEKDPA